jgi:uncharacterized repeat protein (TIGR01451 family)
VCGLATLVVLVATLVLAPIATASAATSTTDDVAPAVTGSVDLVVATTDGGATPIGGVSGSDTFTYTITVDNEGPSDASATATVTDLLPAGVDFVAYGTLPAGVTCTPPSGRTLECTIAAGLLAVASPAVVVAVDVAVPATTPGGEVTNQVVVDSPDDSAPCTITATDITCDPTGTDNFSQVVTGVIQIIAEPPPTSTTPPPTTATPSPPAVEVSPEVDVRGATLAFTGSNRGWMALTGAALVGVGMVLVVATRRREQFPT